MIDYHPHNHNHSMKAYITSATTNITIAKYQNKVSLLRLVTPTNDKPQLLSPKVPTTDVAATIADVTKE